MIPIIIVVPLVQLIILVNAATMEMKNINMVVMDLDQSHTSRGLINSFACSPFFKISAECYSDHVAETYLLANKADLVLCIPIHFERDLIKESHAKVQVLANAINGTVAGISNAYVNMITSGYNRDIILSWFPSSQNSSAGKSINVISTFWFNPELNYKIFMVPAILVILVTIIGMFLTGLNLVREKEMGTIEQINVTPIQKYQFIIGKLIPFWIIALFELGFGMTLGKILFDVPIVGSIWLIYGITMVYLFVVLGIGLLISTASETQQQAMFINFFIIIVLIMLSGIFTPVESMPVWAQKFNYINPIAYLMRAIRMIMLKGSTFRDIRFEFFSLVAFGIAMLSLAVWRYKKTS
jgi:ABC-2 type transport system permease protein